MAKERYNLVSTVRSLLSEQGYSSVAVVNAINAAMGQLVETKRTIKLGDGSVTKNAYRVSESESRRFEGKRNGALDMDAFNSHIGKIEKRLGAMVLKEFPESIKDWLSAHPAFKPTTAVEEKKEETEPATI